MLVSTAIATAAAGGGTFAYITNSASNNVSVIDIVTNNITATINIGSLPFGVAASPDGKKAYVTNYLSSNVSIIDTITNTFITTVNVGSLPVAFGHFFASQEIPTITWNNPADITYGTPLDNTHLNTSASYLGALPMIQQPGLY